MKRSTLRNVTQMVLGGVAFIAFVVLIADVQEEKTIELSHLILIKAIAIIGIVLSVLGIQKLK